MPAHVQPAEWSTDICTITDENTESFTGDPGLVELRWEEIPQLITDLRRAYNGHKQQLPNGEVLPNK